MDELRKGSPGRSFREQALNAEEDLMMEKPGERGHQADKMALNGS